MSKELAVLVEPEQGISASEIAGLFDPASKDSLTARERTLLTGLLSREGSIDTAIPDSISQAELWETLSVCCGVFEKLRRASSHLKLLIGRALVLLKDSPAIYESRGFKSFDDFMTLENGLPGITGISRSELYKAKTVAEKLPTLGLEEARAMGFTKLVLIAQVTTESAPDFQEWVTQATEGTIPQLKEKMYRSDKQIPQGSVDWEVVQFTVTVEQKQQIDAFMVDPDMIAYTGNRNPGFILSRMIEECEAEWRLQAQAMTALDK